MASATDPALEIDARRPRRGIGPFSVRHLLTILGVLVGAGLVLTIVTMPIDVAPPPTARPGSSQFLIAAPTAGLRVGDLAPELAGTVDGRSVELVDLDERPVRLADLRGRPVWINFWATWCPPCQEEVPVVRAVFERHRVEGLVVLGISVQETSPEDVRAYASRYELAYTIGFDATSAIFKTYRIFGLPTHLFLDRDGVIRRVVNGPITEAEAEAIIGPLLEAR
ncbi:MAG: TlpA family protein disulfide reductase [Chloroflexi bacterium]|nr:TlpA family protein disulfide reductase [Chloroflexota bacterium]